MLVALAAVEETWPYAEEEEVTALLVEEAEAEAEAETAELEMPNWTEYWKVPSASLMSWRP
jgi:hypothetical protein